MVRLADQSAPVDPPPARHGTCRLQLTIGGTSYSIRPILSQPRGIIVWALRALDGPRAGTRYSVASVNRDLGCTCPDHEINEVVCKHIAALRAIGLVPRSARTSREAAADEISRTARRPARELAALKGRIHDKPSSENRKSFARARRKDKPAAEPVAALAEGGAQ